MTGMKADYTISIRSLQVEIRLTVPAEETKMVTQAVTPAAKVGRTGTIA